MRRHVLACAILSAIGITAGASGAWADPVVLANGSSLREYLRVFQGGTAGEDYRDLWGLFPTSGTGTFSDALTLSARGVSLSATSELTTSISQTQFSGSGAAAASTSTDFTFDPATTSYTAIASATLVIEFMLTAPHAYSFDGDYGGFSSAILYRLIPLGPDSSAVHTYFSDSVSDIKQHTQYFGMLQPGRHYLQASGGVVIGYPDEGTGDTARFDVRLSLAPVGAEPIPEPASVLLLGTGVVGLIKMRRRR